ncbi:uncharacterized protein MYCGRDRAFT_105698 [Zymoseptoria tritici IPO323]|uniref:Uncharacterized protein n=1 Tax=Zymoseptoria tritici (strain CBS 115943 / IPO323) TaxID=336722 RepID=F9XJV9_ZYMTI|nr:uncharacterized protein MYCGRDRAFT_105698 [Zymoseptoria tritici IPO323]EGP84728.1 hypothetical protein MYCGRDRAFT_105698 [Zymoseptoria tritici IPO323]
MRSNYEVLNDVVEKMRKPQSYQTCCFSRKPAPPANEYLVWQPGSRNSVSPWDSTWDANMSHDTTLSSTNRLPGGALW